MKISSLVIIIVLFSGCGEVRVIDLKNRPVPGATVEIHGDNTLHETVITDDNGEFKFYDLQFSLRKNTRANIKKDGYKDAVYLRGDGNEIRILPILHPSDSPGVIYK